MYTFGLTLAQLKSKLGILQDTLDLAQDSKDFSQFDGKLKSLAEDSEDLKLLHEVEQYFKTLKSEDYEELLFSLRLDPEIERINELLDSYKTINTYHIEFQDVSFKYSPDSDYVFQNINCDFKEGITHGIVSASGLGKTTFLNLAIGLLKPTSGKVLINGEDINSLSFNHARLMSNTAYITQNTQMFMESILVNLLLGNLPLLHRVLLLEKEGKLTREAGIKAVSFKLLESLRQAQALHFVMLQESGLLTLIGDRVGVSNVGNRFVWRSAAKTCSG